MATTTNTGAKKIDQNEQWRNILGIHNDTVDAYDGHIAKLDESIAIVSDGNTHAAIAAGQYVYVKNHGTLTEGLYTANSAISANATLSNSNVTAVSGGGLNALNSKTTTYDFGSLATISAFKSALDTYGETMTSGDQKAIKVTFSASSAPFANTIYVGTMWRNNTNRYEVMLNRSGKGEVVHGCKTSSGWEWSRFAKRDVAGTYEYYPVVFGTNAQSGEYTSSMIPLMNADDRTFSNVHFYRPGGEEISATIQKRKTGIYITSSAQNIAGTMILVSFTVT
jgi:hypothetical protein